MKDFKKNKIIMPIILKAIHNCKEILKNSNINIKIYKMKLLQTKKNLSTWILKWENKKWKFKI